MKKIIICALIAIGFLLLCAIGLALSGLLFWGIGVFITWAFAINFEWTFWHGMSITLILTVLSMVVEQFRKD